MTASPRPIRLRSEQIELAQLLKFAGLVATGGEAKQAIASGLVRVNGTVETQRSKKIRSGDHVAYEGQLLLVQTGG